MKELEVLAPVGSFKNLRLAIDSGANAVYFGVKDFNARQKAENVPLEELEKFVRLAHLHNVKTYMTLNTLIKDSEFNRVLEIVDESIKCNVDAFIVQDIGLASYLLDHYKNIELHASTQMGIHNLDGAKALEELGFKRVVLSRETKLKDIIEIKNNTGLEIEYFVLGSLCVAFSGNCYFSSLCFNESGNRGRCLQPCRMLYEAFSNNKKVKDGYLISPKDLCLIGKLKELIDAGVTSFKIEGRLRRESYLIQSTLSYIKALNDKADISSEIEKLKKVFSRGDYNQGYYLTGNDNIIDTKNANHKGEKIGRVISYKPFKDLYKIDLCVKHPLKNGDGIKLFDGVKEVTLGIGNVEILKNKNQVIYSKHKPIIGDVYLSLDREYEENLIPKHKKILLNLNIVAEPQKPLIANINGSNFNLKIKSDFLCEEAKNKPLENKDFVEIFSRIKDTEFEFKQIDTDIKNIFITKSIINKFKNYCILQVENHIIGNVNKLTSNVYKIGECDKKYEFSDSMGNNNDLIICNNETVLNNKNEVVLSPEFYNLKVIEKFYNDKNLSFLYLNLPVVATGDEIKIIDEILSCFGTGKIGVIINNYWGLKYLQMGYKTIAGYNMNIINNYSKNFYQRYGFINFVRSIELPLVDGLLGGITYNGYPTLMTWCHCPYKVSMGSSCDKCKFNNKLMYRLNDGKQFRIRRYKIINCYFELVSTKKIESKAKNKMIDLR